MNSKDPRAYEIIGSADERLAASYRPDFICYGDILVELKALSQITTIEISQVINYLKAGKYPTGLLFNFGAPSFQYKRYIYTKNQERPPALDIETGT